ncbi:MAG: tetratricopeptide repeat protein, partial [Planctomycetota bacterium]|nr:tetratricopeptide repeat protein [Planctomycetota bacterium]
DAAPTDPTGTPFGRYRLLDQLGSGGMGIVHKAWDSELRRVVALKMLKVEEGQGDPESVERFIREARSAARLHHPNIVHVDDVGTYEGRHYFTMDYVEGEDLQVLLEKDAESESEGRPGTGRLLPMRKRLEILKDIARALQHAHANGIIHRDLKPENIIITPDRGPVLTDFGLARDMTDASRSRLTVTGQVMGTPPYMPPEQMQGDGSRIGPHSDVYSLGAIMYELLTDRVPFESADLFELRRLVRDTDAVPPRKVAPHVHQDAETICLKAIEKDPTRRYAGAGEFADDLERHLNGEPILARRTPGLARLWRKAKRRKSVVVPVAGSVLIVLCVLVAWLVYSARKRERFTGLVSDADWAFAAGNFKDARLMYERANEIDDGDDHVKTRLAASLAAIERAAKIRDDAGILCARGKSAASTDPAGDAAFESFTKAIETDPSYAEPYFERAGVRWRRRQYDGALADLTAAIKNDPRFVNAYRDRALILEELGETGKALADFANVVQLDPESDAGRFANGVLLRKEGKLDAAIAEYDRAIGLNPRLHWAYNNRGNARFARDDFEGAIVDLDKAIELRPGFAAAYFNRGNVRCKTGDVEGAIDDYSKALAADPRHAEAFMNRAYARDAKGDRTGAIADYDKAIDIRPDYHGAYYNRAGVKRAAGDLDGAIRDYTEAIRLRPDFADAYVFRGLTHGEKQMTDEAMRDFTKAIELDEDNALAYFGLGNALDQAGRPKEAIDAWKKALEIAPADWPSRKLVEECIAETEKGLKER